MTRRRCGQRKAAATATGNGFFQCGREIEITGLVIWRVGIGYVCGQNLLSVSAQTKSLLLEGKRIIDSADHVDSGLVSYTAGFEAIPVPGKLMPLNGHAPAIIATFFLSIGKYCRTDRGRGGRIASFCNGLFSLIVAGSGKIEP